MEGRNENIIMKEDTADRTQVELVFEDEIYLVNDSEPHLVKGLKLDGLLEYIRANPVTKKRITYQEYPSYRKFEFIDFDKLEAFYFLTDGLRIALMLRVFTSEEKWENFFFEPSLEYRLPWHEWPSQYSKKYEPEERMFVSLLEKLEIEFGWLEKEQAYRHLQGQGGEDSESDCQSGLIQTNADGAV